MTNLSYERYKLMQEQNIKTYIEQVLSCWETTLSSEKKILNKMTTTPYKEFMGTRVLLMESFINDLNMILSELKESQDEDD